MMAVYHVAALDHQGDLLTSFDQHITPKNGVVTVRLAWRIGTVAITGPCGCILAIIALPAGHPSQHPADIHIELEHTQENE